MLTLKLRGWITLVNVSVVLLLEIKQMQVELSSGWQPSLTWLTPAGTPLVEIH